MLGKMYRPLQVSSIQGKRGYKFLNKYKSRFAGTYKFTMDIYLNYQSNKNTEMINIDFFDLQIPVVINQVKYVEDPVINTKRNEKTDDFESDDIENKANDFYISNTETEPLADLNPKIMTLRRMLRPTKIYTRESLTFTTPIISNRDDKENDLLIFEMLPKVFDNKEYMVLNIICKTPIIASCKKGVKYSNRS